MTQAPKLPPSEVKTVTASDPVVEVGFSSSGGGGISSVFRDMGWHYVFRDGTRSRRLLVWVTYGTMGVR